MFVFGCGCADPAAFTSSGALTFIGTGTFGGSVYLTGSSGITVNGASSNFAADVTVGVQTRQITLTLGQVTGTYHTTASFQIIASVAAGRVWTGAFVQSTPAGSIALQGAGTYSGPVTLNSNFGLSVSAIYTGTVSGFINAAAQIQCVVGCYFAGTVLAGPALLDFYVGAASVTVPSSASIIQTGTNGRISLTGSGIHGETLSVAGPSAVQLLARSFSTITAYDDVTISLSAAGYNFTGIIESSSHVVTLAVGSVGIGPMGTLKQSEAGGQFVVTGSGTILMTTALMYPDATFGLVVNGPTYQGTIRGAAARDVGVILNTGSITGTVTAVPGGIMTVELGASETFSGTLSSSQPGTTYRLKNGAGNGLFNGPLNFFQASTTVIVECPVSAAIQFGAPNQKLIALAPITGTSLVNGGGDLLSNNTATMSVPIFVSGGVVTIEWTSVGGSSPITISSMAMLIIRGGLWTGNIVFSGPNIPYSLMAVGTARISGGMGIQASPCRIYTGGSASIMGNTTMPALDATLNITHDSSVTWTGQFVQDSMLAVIRISGSGNFAVGPITLAYGGQIVLESKFLGTMTNNIVTASTASYATAVFDAAPGRYQGAIIVTYGPLLLQGGGGLSSGK